MIISAKNCVGVENRKANWQAGTLVFAHLRCFEIVGLFEAGVFVWQFIHFSIALAPCAAAATAPVEHQRPHTYTDWQKNAFFYSLLRPVLPSSCS